MSKRALPAKKSSTLAAYVPEVNAGGASDDQQATFPIVGIGASAGGLGALEAFLTALPPENAAGMAFVIIQHLSPDHKSILSDLLKRYTEMSVLEAEDGIQIERNNVYIIPPNREMGVLDNKLQLFEPKPVRGVRHPIDFFFRSLAADRREQSICVVLSGTGSDGALGVRQVKGEGGMAMVQTPDSTEFDGMPRSAIATGLVDYILPPDEMPAQLIKYTSQMASRPLTRIVKSPANPPDVLAKLAVILRAKTGHDFSQYKESTILRRVERRMALHQIEDVNDYVRFLQQNASEVTGLFRDLLIGVTSFFRDREAFVALENNVIPRLVASALEQGTLRAWVCGCSTGEEAYSLSILIQEYLERIQKVCNVQIFATDLDRHATEQARAGVFAASVADDISPERLARFFTQDKGGSFRAEKVIRDRIIFSEQDLLKDPPFSRLHLITCRNLLIYLNAEVQKRLIPLFHYALNGGGILFLGSAEAIGDQPTLFDVVDRTNKIYMKKSDGMEPVPRMGELLPNTEVRQSSQTVEGRRAIKPNLREITERALLNHFDAAAVLVNGRGEILYFHGRTGNYLEPAPGDAASNIIAMAREGLRRDLTAALQRVVAKRELVQVNGLQVKANGHRVTVNLSILPAIAPIAELFLVVLEEKPLIQSTETSAPQLSVNTTGEVARLERVIRAKDDYIQTIIEQMETSSEELRSSNEEMQSVNEELRSANEELETSREELQSVNEELATVNAELQQKVADLSRANNDMNNLLAGTGVGTLFVDHQMRIARFTPSVTQVINFIESDVGRPLEHIVSNIVGYDRLLTDVKKVLDTLTPVEIEVETRSGAWYILAVRPYRTLENVIEGAVITFVDITKRKFAEQALIEANRFRQAAQIETVGIAFFKLSGAFTSANESFLHLMGYSRAELESGDLHWDLITPTDFLEVHLSSLEQLRNTNRPIPMERQFLRKDGSSGTALFATWRLSEAEAVVYVISVAPEHFSGVR